ncbi:hypothetical protein CHS0354_024232 [Potamilus streckersoni]|uniref:MAD2L1-binding protein n=1 Tax=Potamilus streckersoni TaxID=2493646 RepID=A0AAE0SBQ3_9BIVA|nr:hypothetical protein CHS0354_024232 [Potamilus streckersoni]
MANTTVRKEDKCMFNFCFDGGLMTNTRAALIKDLIKYILYERQQIPMPYENVKQELQLMENDIENQDPGSKKKRLYNKLEMKKAKEVINNIDEICIQLGNAFDICPDIKSVLILIGATTVSPKEIYMISLPPLNPEANNVPYQSCVKTLFRQLIADDVFACSKEISPTNVTVLLHASRNSGIRWFLPKSTFKVPQRGMQYHLNLTSLNDEPVNNNHNLSIDLEEVEISGIEPLEKAYMATSTEELYESFHLVIQKPSSESSTFSHSSFAQMMYASRSLSNHCQDVSTDIRLSDMVRDEDIPMASIEDFIWFQSPLVIKGYKDKSSRQLADDILL